MTAEDYIKQELTNGHLTYAHIATLTRAYQRLLGLTVDGKPGKLTRDQLDMTKDADPSTPISGLPNPTVKFLHNPLPTLGDGRVATVTSEYRPADRPKHNGLDFFYQWRKGDNPNFVGDKGAAGKNADGTPKWVIPYGIEARAAAAGTVQVAGNSETGYRVWIDHFNGWRTGYFHLTTCAVHAGDKVPQGWPLGMVGDNPNDTDGRHLHFELSLVDRYAPVDPMKYFLVKP